SNSDLDMLARLFTLESHKLIPLPEGAQPGFVVQQIGERAHHQGDDALRDDCERWLYKYGYFHTLRGMRYAADSALLRVLSGHTGAVNGALELKNECLLSWADGVGNQDYTVRLWSAQGQPLVLLSGHTDWVSGVVELKDGRLLSWSRDGTLWLWS